MKELNLDYGGGISFSFFGFSVLLSLKEFTKVAWGLKNKNMGFAGKTSCNENVFCFSILVGFWFKLQM